MCEVHACSGLDSYKEIELHPLITHALAASTFGVARETGYPTPSRDRPNDAQRQRCDLVVMPTRNMRLYDPVDEQRQQDKAVGTLFESHTQVIQPPPQGVLPEDALWIEVKSVGQYSYVDGVPGPNTKYTQELLNGPRADVIKLASDPLIKHGIALVVLFSEDQETGPHDIAASANAMIEHDLPISVPIFESFPIMNHAGNAWCTLGMIPVKL